MLQKYNVEEDPTDPAPPPLSSSLSLFSRLQLELTRTRTRGTRTRTRWTRTRSRWTRGRTRRTRGILSTWMKNWNPNFDSVEEVWSPGARGPCLYSLFRWIWAVGSNRHWLNGYPWSFRSVERSPEAESRLGSNPGRAPKGDGRAPCPRARSSSRSFPWLLDSSRW